jgi:hypothetical protein
MDQGLFTAPHGLSQCTTSFIASCCQGIHQTPLSRLIRSGKSKAGVLTPSSVAGPFASPAPVSGQKLVHFPLRGSRPRSTRHPEGCRRSVYQTWNSLVSRRLRPGVPGPAGPSPLGGADTKLMCISLNDVKPASSRRRVRLDGRGARAGRLDDPFGSGQRAKAPWWVEEDLNLRPHAYQACALTT